VVFQGEVLVVAEAVVEEAAGNPNVDDKNHKVFYTLKICKRFLLIYKLRGNSSVVERLLAKEEAAGSNPVSRSRKVFSKFPKIFILIKAF
jgi:hypothetical protein